MGTSVLTPTFRYHPSIVAQAFGTLGSMFPGRVILGIGTGEGLNEVPSTGQPWPEFKERFARMREAVQLMRKLWTEERVSFEGQYYRTEHATIYDRPETPVPIYVAAAGAMVAKYAGRAGDGFICTSGKKPELYTETLLPNVVAGLEAAAAPKPDYDRMIEVKVSFDTDKQRALEDTRHWAALALSAEEKMSVEDRWKWNAWPMRCRWNAPPAVGLFPTIRKNMWNASAITSDLAFGIWCSMRRDQIRRGSCGCMGSRCCHCCAAASLESRVAAFCAARPAHGAAGR
jgi:coenzyme F420-dependent glucose-6-phosphate dehydrogenase